MQIPSSIHHGDLVSIRRQLWRVVDLRSYEGCRLLMLAGAERANSGTERRILLPFDHADQIGQARASRLVRPQRWRRACRALLAEWSPPGGLRAARRARIDLLSHQLEPALAAIRGRGTRLLLADAVGLGKTIQAGLVVAELQARGLAERVLIAAPAGLREQWVAELEERFGMTATIADFRELRSRATQMPAGLNPWMTLPFAVTSLDFLKRLEILPAVLACRWDVLIVDEAHGAGPDSDRYAAVSALAARATYVLLLTATPHNGDARSFTALGDLGARGEPLLVFRRSKADVDLAADRHTHTLHVRSSAVEARMHSLLADFAKAARAEHDSADSWLALAVLHKRAFSSAHALALTVVRRLAALAPDHTGGRQLALPLRDDDGELDAADEPPDGLASLALADGRRERRLLGALLDAARAAATAEAKIGAIKRLIARIAEPILIFTEFRDTLSHVQAALGLPVAILHGGLSRPERSAAVEAFVKGGRQVLLATDAAGEGLNLQQRCRTVINFELPWNPMRLEQRAGRVDRIGQRRTVHVFHLVGRSTGEVRVLERLQARLARANVDITVASPLRDDDRATARLVVDGHDSEAEQSASAPSAQLPRARIAVHTESDARHEAARLIAARRLWSDDDARALAALEATGPWIARTRSSKTRRRVGRRIVAIMRVDYEDGSGRGFESTLVAMTMPLPNRAGLASRDIRAIVDAAAPALRAHADHVAALGHDRSVECAAALAIARLTRAQRVAETGSVSLDPLQPGLFDRRAERAHDAARTAAARSHADVIEYSVDGGRPEGTITRRPARLLLVLVP